MKEIRSMQSLSTTDAEPLAEQAHPSRLAALDTGLLQRFDISGPRYTSYPTADRFIEAFDSRTLESWLHARSVGARATPLSVYVHVPFCESLCHYCACNKIITRDHAKGTAYLDDLAREIALYRGVFASTSATAAKPVVSHLHLGGGSPTFLSDAELARLIGLIGNAFQLDTGDAGERSIEVDPRTVSRERMAALAALGFNRVSFGVQDFDADVQRAVHRVQSTQQVFDLVAASRELGFRSTNIDLIYGLPRQTSASFKTTLDTLRALRPDRIALYAYAHLPARFKPQRRIVDAELPRAEDKVRMVQQAMEALLADGYVYIGMDHFALPDDSLAIAKAQGRLHRNFQGYTDQPDGDLIGLGVSSISKIGPTYSQNAKTIAEYRDFLAQERLPVVKGIELSADDILRRSLIMALMCQGRVSIEAMEIAHLIDFRKTFASELQELAQFENLGLIECSDEWLQVTERGWYFVRAIAMVFDRYLRASQEHARFSRIL
ncbi:oxygen-independent coproporphyrinogen III oxidase [Uliginosibacterium sp. H3]|uniref:Coproporphyrinogen-III oxidase n=1 Tax=Uliginosibacterium silvisoli TaxID=3114758 RepID=A0ABU6K1D8_9RHOO|nr:oxygen-independent coproporphyrinogen III oxidase [Uliginosibacterium sp. H3]